MALARAGETEFVNEAGEFLVRAGYSAADLIKDCPYTVRNQDGALSRKQVSLAAFSRKPHDFSSACISVLSGTPETLPDQLSDLRFLAAPVAIAAVGDTVQLFSLTQNRPRSIEVTPREEWRSHLASRVAHLSPSAITGAKSAQIQLEFVDAGLAEWTASVTSQSLKLLLESLIKEILAQLDRPGRATQDTALRMIFQLFACRALEDKGVVPTADDPAAAIEQAREYCSGSFDEDVLGGTLPDGMVQEVFQRLKRDFSFATLTSEILGYAYENALVTPALRHELGIYYTPRYVTEYVLKRLPIEALPLENRYLADPCCGCGSFLLAGLTRLGSALPSDWSTARRHQYLRARIVGSDVDVFARELSSLALILADIENRNGWKVFPADVLDLQAADFSRRPSIIVTNPPFKELKALGERRELAAVIIEKLLEIADREAFLGIVLPLSVLDSRAATQARMRILDQCRVSEIVMLPATVFESQTETAILLLQKTSERPKSSVVVREVKVGDLGKFSRTGTFTRTYPVDPTSWAVDSSSRFLVSPLVDTWKRMSGRLVKLGDVAVVRNGVQVRADDEDSVATTRRGTDDVPFIDRTDVVRPFSLLTEQGLRPTKWLRYGEQLHRARDPNIFRQQKVLINSNRNPSSAWRLVAAVSRQTIFFSENFHGVIPTAGVTVEQLAAVLNGPFANAWFDAHCRKRKVVQAILQQCPFPQFEEPIGSQITSLVRALESALLAVRRLETEGLFNDAPVESGDTVALLNDIDSLVFDAYGLSREDRRQILKYMSSDKRPS